MKGEGRIFGENPACERGVRVEVSGGVATKDRAVARGEVGGGQLNRRRKRVPVNDLNGNMLMRGQSRVEIIDFEIAIHSKVRKSSAGISRERGPTMNAERQIGR